MSQVIRKYKEAGKIEQSKPELFERKGVGKYKKDDLIAGLYRNIDTYGKNNNLSGDKFNTFRDTTNQLIKGIESGTIIMNGDGTFTDTTGSMSSTGKFDKNWIGGSKNTQNNAINLAGDYAKDYISQMQQYTEPTPAKKSKFKSDDYIRKEISKSWYGGNEMDTDNFFKNRSEEDRLGLLSNIVNSADYNKLFEEHDWSDTGVNTVDDLANRFKGFGTAISNGTLDNEDYNTFAALGGSNLDKYLKQPTTQPAQPDLQAAKSDQLKQQAISEGYISEDAIKAYIDKNQIEQSKRDQALIDERDRLQKRQSTEAYFNEYQKKNPFTSSISGNYAGIKPSYSKEGLDNYLKTDEGNYFSNILSRQVFTPEKGQNVVNNFDYLQQRNPEALIDVGDGYQAIPTTYDFNRYSAIAYNPTSQQYKEVSMMANEMLKKIAFSHYENPKPAIKQNPPKGMKFQEGGIISYDLIRNRIAEEQAQKAKASEQKATASGKTPERAKADSAPHTSFSDADKMRMGALTGDVASLIASMTGVGSVASAGIGAASTGMNQAADMMEGQSFGQSLWNNAGSYALDALSLIPFAKAAKVPKMIKAVSKFAPLMTTALAGYQGLANYDAYKNTWGKVGSGESLNVEDWRNILTSLQLVAGGTAATHRASKAKSNVAAAKSTDKVWMKTPQGWKSVNADLASKVSATTGIDAQNALLKDVGIRLEEHKSWGGFGKGTGSAKVKTSDYYDFSKPVTTYSGDLPLQHTFGPGERALGNAQMPDIRIPGVRNLYNKVVHPQAYKKSKVAKQTAEPAKSKELLGLPTPEQATKGTRGSFGPTATTGRHIDDYTDPTKLRGQRIKSEIEKGNPELTARRAIESNAKANKELVNTSNAAWATNQSFPRQPLMGAARANKQRTYEQVFSNQPNFERVGTGQVQTATRPISQPAVAEFRSPKPPISNPPAVRPATKINPLEQFLAKSPSNRVTAIVNEQLTNTGKRVAESIVKSKTKSGKPIKSVIDALVPGNPRGHDKRAKELQAIFDAPVTIEKATVKKPKISEEYIPKAKNKTSKRNKKTSKDDKVTKKADGGILFMQSGNILGAASSKGKFNLSVKPEDVLSLGRMVGGLATNNKVASLYKKGLKPTLLDTFENTVPLQGNFQAKSMAEQQAGNLESMAARPRTSDASLQLAGELEASDRAGQARQQGSMQDAERYFQTRMMGQQESDAAKGRRVEVGNRNTVAMNQINAAKKQIDAGKLTANYQQVVAPWMAGIENKYKQDRLVNRQMAMEEAQRNTEREYSPQFDRIKRDEMLAQKAYLEADKNNTINSWYTTDQFAGFSDRYKQTNTALSDALFNNRKSLTGASSFMFNVSPRQQSTIAYKASGGKLSVEDKKKLQNAKDFNRRVLEDSKQFHKDIMDSKREHNKLLMSMSSLTSELIKKAMS